MAEDNDNLRAQIERLTALVESQQKEIEETKRKEEEDKKDSKKNPKKDDEKKGFNGVSFVFSLILIAALGILAVYALLALTGKEPQKIKLPGEKKQITKKDEAEQINISKLLQADNVTFTSADGYENCLWLNYDLVAQKRSTEWNITVRRESKVVVTKYDGSVQEYAFDVNHYYSTTFYSKSEAYKISAPAILLVDTMETEIKSIVLTDIMLTNSYGNAFYDKKFEINIK